MRRNRLVEALKVWPGQPSSSSRETTRTILTEFTYGSCTNPKVIPGSSNPKVIIVPAIIEPEGLWWGHGSTRCRCPNEAAWSA